MRKNNTFLPVGCLATGYFFDLESLPDQRCLQNPELVLSGLSGLVILDEIQSMPELFGVLRVLVDNPENRARFFLLGFIAQAKFVRQF